MEITVRGRKNPASTDLEAETWKQRVGEIYVLADLPRVELLARWIELHGNSPPRSIRQSFLVRALAYTLQERTLGGLTASEHKALVSLAEGKEDTGQSSIKSGTRLYREWQGITHEVVVSAEGYCWRGQSYKSLSQVARAITGTRWSGPRFFGLKR